MTGPVNAAKGAGAPSMGGSPNSPKLPSATQQKTEVLSQTRRLSVCPAKMAVGGFVIAAAIGYVTLYSNKKPEATAIDVAKVATGTATPANTRPRN